MPPPAWAARGPTKTNSAVANGSVYHGHAGIFVVRDVDVAGGAVDGHVIDAEPGRDRRRQLPASSRVFAIAGSAVYHGHRTGIIPVGLEGSVNRVGGIIDCDPPRV